MNEQVIVIDKGRFSAALRVIREAGGYVTLNNLMVVHPMDVNIGAVMALRDANLLVFDGSKLVMSPLAKAIVARPDESRQAWALVTTKPLHDPDVDEHMILVRRIASVARTATIVALDGHQFKIRNEHVIATFPTWAQAEEQRDWLVETINATRTNNMLTMQQAAAQVQTAMVMLEMQVRNVYGKYSIA